MSETSPGAPRLVRFSVYELDLTSGDLRKSGARLTLQQQPLQLLSVLLEQPGELVTREELRKRLWPDDTFVDFEHGLNAAVKRLRDTLDDSADSPRFVETVPRRGYRFIAEAVREPTPLARTAGARRTLPWRPIGWAALGAGIAVLLTMMPVGPGRRSELSGPVVATSVLVKGSLGMLDPGVDFAVEPSGRAVVFSGEYGSNTIMYRRDLDQVDPQPLLGTDGASDVFFSDDGRQIGFETRSELWTAALDGGTPQRLYPNQPLRGGTWGEGGRIVIGRVGTGLWMVSTNGGEPRQLTAPQQGERHELPQMLPGGRAVLFTILASDKAPQAAVYHLERGETRSLFEGMSARFVGPGHVVFGLQGKLWAVGFDPESLETTGAARPVRHDVLWSVQGYPQFAVGAGVLAYVRTPGASNRTGNRVLAWIDRNGTRRDLPLKADNFHLPRLSPTGDRFVVQIGIDRALWAYHLSRGTMTRLVSDRIIAYSAPAWTSDGTRVIFTTWFDGDVGLGWVGPDGSSPPDVLIKGVGLRSFERTNPVMLRDASGVVLTGLAPGASVEDLLFVPLVGERHLEALFQAPGVERNAAISPNGRFIAYSSDEFGRSEVYVRPFPKAGSRRWPISRDGGAGPVWTKGGSEIVYVDSQGRMMAVRVRGDNDGELDPSTPEPLFKVPGIFDLGLDRGWDVTANGEQFLFALSDDAGAGRDTAMELILIQNWAKEFQRLAPREIR
jgi:DNA-binding winged helix-turn-helix (wHTH) protein